MKLKIEITMDNAAFEATPAIESARILERLSAKILDGYLGMTGGESIVLLDLNGNRVGTAEVTS